ncbi:MAG: ATP-binding protein [Solirubrobacteraceae bacterium]
MSATSAGSVGSGPPSVPASEPVVPELRFVSVLFVDLVGFTALSEGREAEDVRELLGRYFLSARTIVERYGGLVEKFIGDAVMAVWGSRTAQEDDGERAVRAALEIVDAVTAFGQEVGAPGLRARAGVVTGQVAAMENADEGIVVGDRVNTASRVQSVAAPGSVLVDEVTRQVASAAVLFDDAGEHVVKGKEHPLRLWRAVRVVAGAGGRDREQLIEAPFVGRDPELRLIKDQFHTTVERGAARLVAISGEAGVGKSRLRREFSTYIDGLADTFLWHAGRCLSHGDGVAFWALGEMVRQRLGIAEDAGTQEAKAKLDGALLEWVPDAADREFIMPRLGALLGVAQPGFDRAELFGGWRLFFERLAAHEPVILVFEDMQWADDGLIEFIEQLLDWSTRVPIFIVTFARPDLASRREGWPAGRRGATTVNLEPLDDEAIRALLAGVVDGLPSDAADQIVERAQGIPLYAVETVRALTDRGTLTRTDGRLVAAGELGTLQVPASLNALLASRLDALDSHERGLVKAMSVFGGSFPRQAVISLTDLDEQTVDGLLSGLVRKQVLVVRADPLSPERGQYAFAQGMLRAVAYERLSRRERKQRHLAAAHHLQTAFANEGDEVAEVIATHLVDAHRAAAHDSDADELRQRAVEALSRSARRALAVGAPGVARRANEQAAEIADEADRARLLQSAGEMAALGGESEAALGLLDAAADLYALAGRERERAMTAVPATRVLGRLHRQREAIDRLAGALDALGPHHDLDRDKARCNATLGQALVFAGEYDRAEAALETALRIASALELSDVLADALGNKGILHSLTGRVAEGRLLLAGAVEMAREHELVDVLIRAQGNLAALELQFDVPGAREMTAVALAAARRRGDRYLESVSVSNMMTLDLYAGRWDVAEQLATELLDAGDSRPWGEYVHAALVVLHALHGDPDAAERALAPLAGWTESDNPEVKSMLDASTIATRLAQGRSAEALEIALRIVPDAIRFDPSGDGVRQAWPDAINAALALDRHQDAHALIRLLADLPPGHVPPYLRAQLARGRALLAAAEGEHETVEQGLQSAVAMFEKLGYAYWLAVARIDLAAWLIDRDRGDEAAPLLEQAIETLTLLRAAPALERARQLSETIASLAAS